MTNLAGRPPIPRRPPLETSSDGELRYSGPPPGNRSQYALLGVMVVAGLLSLLVHRKEAAPLPAATTTTTVPECAESASGCGCMEQASRTQHILLPCCPLGEAAQLHSGADAYVCEPVEEELPVLHPPETVAHWGACSVSVTRRIEDAYLSDALGSVVDYDPRFGLTDLGIEAAECAARRWRLEGR